MSRLLLVAAAWLLMAAAPAWGDLHDWIGRYPTDFDAKPKRRLLELPPVKAMLRTMLSVADRARLESYAEETPVAETDGYILVNQCMPHDCGARDALVVIDTTASRLWIAFFENNGTVVSTRWFGSTDHAVLPQSVLHAFAAKHTP